MRLLDLGVQALKFNLWLSIVSLKITVHCRTGRWRSQTLSVCVRPTHPDCSQKSRDPCERWPTVLYGWTISERHLTFWLCRLSYQTVGRMEGMLALGEKAAEPEISVWDWEWNHVCYLLKFYFCGDKTERFWRVRIDQAFLKTSNWT